MSYLPTPLKTAWSTSVFDILCKAKGGVKSSFPMKSSKIPTHTHTQITHPHTQDYDFLNTDLTEEKLNSVRLEVTTNQQKWAAFESHTLANYSQPFKNSSSFF